MRCKSALTFAVVVGVNMMGLAVALAEPPDPCIKVSASAHARCVSSPIARCTALAEQWRRTENARTSSPNLGTARGYAASAARLCASKSPSDLAAGALAYQHAIEACDGKGKDPLQ